MFFWTFMLIVNSVIPLTMMTFGRYFMKTAPNKINRIFGYRTSMSMKNKDTWNFAHKHCGKVWFCSGLTMLPITVIVLLFVVGKSIRVIGIAGGSVCGIQLVYLISSILPTEIALRKRFDLNGRKK